MPTLGESLSELDRSVGSPNDVCQATSVLNRRANTRSAFLVGSTRSTTLTVAGALFSWSATRNEFAQLNPQILIGVSKERFVARESAVACALSRTPFRSKNRKANSPVRF